MSRPVESLEVERAARGLVGVAFRHQGRDPASGLDCLGVVVCVARAVGWPTELDRTDYERFPDGAELRAKLVGSGLRALPPQEAQPGDVVQICFAGQTGYGQHLAVVVAGPTELHLIHAYERARRPGRVVEEPLRKWQRGALGAITAAYRFV